MGLWQGVGLCCEEFGFIIEGVSSRSCRIWFFARSHEARKDAVGPIRRFILAGSWDLSLVSKVVSTLINWG